MTRGVAPRQVRYRTGGRVITARDSDWLPPTSDRRPQHVFVRGHEVHAGCANSLTNASRTASGGAGNGCRRRLREPRRSAPRSTARRSSESRSNGEPCRGCSPAWGGTRGPRRPPCARRTTNARSLSQRRHNSSASGSAGERTRPSAREVQVWSFLGRDSPSRGPSIHDTNAILATHDSVRLLCHGVAREWYEHRGVALMWDPRHRARMNRAAMRPSRVLLRSCSVAELTHQAPGRRSDLTWRIVTARPARTRGSCVVGRCGVRQRRPRRLPCLRGHRRVRRAPRQNADRGTQPRVITGGRRSQRSFKTTETHGPSHRCRRSTRTPIATMPSRRPPRFP